MSSLAYTPTFIDLFAGLGGFRIGLESHDMECVFGSDNNKNAADVYYANFGHHIYSDITKVNVSTIPQFDILCGGFPCQPFSSAGKKLGFEDTRGTLFFDLCRIIDNKKPEVVFLENVKNLTTHDKGNTFQVIQESLEKLGYTVAYKVLNALDFGVPQSRERILIVASRSGKTFDFDKIETLPRQPLKSFLDSNDNEFEWLESENYTLIADEHVKTQEKSGLRFVGYINGNLRKKGARENTEHLSRVHKQPNRIYSDEGSHPTLSSQESSGRYFIQTAKNDGTLGVRRLTIAECYRIMGYPNGYIRVGSKAEQYNRIGNSICVPMVSAVASEIKNQLL